MSEANLGYLARSCLKMKTKTGWGGHSVVAHLPSMCEAQCSILSTRVGQGGHQVTLAMLCKKKPPLLVYKGSLGQLKERGLEACWALAREASSHSRRWEVPWLCISWWSRQRVTLHRSPTVPGLYDNGSTVSWVTRRDTGTLRKSHSSFSLPGAWGRLLQTAADRCCWLRAFPKVSSGGGLGHRRGWARQGRWRPSGPHPDWHGVIRSLDLPASAPGNLFCRYRKLEAASTGSPSPP